MAMAGRFALPAAPGLLVVLLLGCATPHKLVQQPVELVPTRHTLLIDQLVIHSDMKLPEDHRLLKELQLQRDDVSQLLALPQSQELIDIYLFDSQEQFASFLRVQYPQFPARRAFFVETDTRLTVYAQWGDRVAEDLRHEVAHGYLHAVVPRIPLWIDEGLAEYFEVPRGTGGLNAPHIELLAAQLDQGGWRPNLARLEALAETEEMDQLDYAEAWAWAHYLLERDPTLRGVLQQYLLDLRQHGMASPLSERLRLLVPQPEQALVHHLYQLSRE